MYISVLKVSKESEKGVNTTKGHTQDFRVLLCKRARWRCVDGGLITYLVLSKQEMNQNIENGCVNSSTILGYVVCDN